MPLMQLRHESVVVAQSGADRVATPQLSIPTYVNTVPTEGA